MFNTLDKERIAIIFRSMDGVKDRNFNLLVWVSSGVAAVSKEEIHTCGMTACAGGYLAISPEFHALGGSGEGYPIYQDWEGLDALEYFISNTDEEYHSNDNVRYLAGLLFGGSVTGHSTRYFYSDHRSRVTVTEVRNKLALLYFMIWFFEPKPMTLGDSSLFTGNHKFEVL